MIKLVTRVEMFTFEGWSIKESGMVKVSKIGCRFLKVLFFILLTVIEIMERMTKVTFILV